MNCMDMTPLLSASLDGEITPAEKAVLDAHLAACSACAAQYERLRAADALFTRMRTAAPAPFFETRLMQRIARRNTAQSFFHDLIAIEKKILYAAAAVAVIVAGVALKMPAGNDYDALRNDFIGGGTELATSALSNSTAAGPDDIAGFLVNSFG